MNVEDPKVIADSIQQLNKALESRIAQIDVMVSANVNKLDSRVGGISSELSNTVSDSVGKLLTALQSIEALLSRLDGAEVVISVKLAPAKE